LKKSNILFALADDASHMSVYGNKFVKTPNFDRVAKGGILFQNAFTTNPKCAPSRASILTGMHTWQLGPACNHFGVFPAKYSVYPDLLEKEVGYYVGYTGKGWAPGSWKKGGFNRNPAGNEYNSIRLNPPEYTLVSSIDYAANFCQFLSEKPKGKPFCFWYGGHEPHRPYNKGEGERAGKTRKDVQPPPYLPDDEIVKRDLLDYAFEIEWFDRHLGMMLNHLEKIGELDNTLVVVTSDNGMPFPRVKGQMYEHDFHLPLAISWPEIIKGGRIVKDLVSFIDFAPTFLEVAGIEIPSQMEGKSLTNVLKSSESEYIDKTRDRVFMGKERHDLGRENDVGYPVRCIRTPEYLYVRNFKPDCWPAGNPETGFTNCDSSPTKELVLKLNSQGNNFYFDLAFGKRPAEELYNILEDPQCMHNLAECEDYQDLKEKLSKELVKKLKETNDPRILGKGDIFDNYQYVGEDNHSWKAYMERRFTKQKY